MYSIEEIDSIVEKGISLLDFRLEPQELYQPLEYMISIGGKRLRPKMCLLAYSLFADKIDNSIIHPAMALEVFHTFTLIHDDIMDNADVRRGHATVHKKWSDNVAILSGDVMSIKSYELLGHAPAHLLPDVLSIFSKTAAQVCEGQQYDMNFEKMPFIVGDDYIQMISLKTAVLMACSMQIGALIGGAGKETAEVLYQFGYDLGIAFQIKDDYLDIFGTSSIFGKTVGGDILNNKKTWLLVETFKRATGDDTIELNRLLNLGQEAAEEKISGVTKLYEKLEVKEAAEKEMELYHSQAIKKLNDLELTDVQKMTLKDFANNLINREK